jgi:hypothetical protein
MEGRGYEVRSNTPGGMLVHYTPTGYLVKV